MQIMLLELKNPLLKFYKQMAARAYMPPPHMVALAKLLFRWKNCGTIMSLLVQPETISFNKECI